ncbi:TPA: hypothetical protein L5A14_006767 [Pseudomonas aeruginosa]|uniref:hypothetical protein n=1 Tax=Pseudomonas aeruginosa TaxID=287 RepID=UPI0003D03157|nr:hypothetical protein [Pseudomonas aeruginosa]AMA37831.1 hypothetical protein DPADHS01_17790 [Pseudomonas aeruginosa DHS01]AMA38837.1 hypothetical protein DPADHS01_23065 [Pseudomonas aeruginosa DHS01]EKY0461286.1 hypothetical protein [Pseudomonas aeruginosa]EMB7764443.1 hypothetical protein [Pseudomonas aeruginosa]ESZ78871.1 hypothetical protein V441_33760 [Pseudomonas aeruginosa DHS29]
MTPRIGVALWVLDRHEWNWRRLNRSAFIMRKKMAAKSVALIAHDRILTDEVLTRGLPSYWDRETKEVEA